MKIKDLNYFTSNEFAEKEELTMEEVLQFSALLPVNKATGKSFAEMFILTDDNGEKWININGKLKHIRNTTHDDIMFF